MVYFSCDGCGECLKKNQVDGHAARCRRCASVSCADCQVSFYGDDYRAHTSCMTEVERYETKGVRNGNNGNKPKKVTPQEMWSRLIQDAASAASGSSDNNSGMPPPPPANVGSYLQQIAMLDNVPRKEKQFRNFCANSLKLRGGDAILSSIWEYLKGLREQQQKEKSEEAAAAKAKTETEAKSSLDEENDSASVPKQTSPPPSHDDNGDVPMINDLNAKSVKKAMKRVLKKANNHKLSNKRLQKQVQAHLKILLKREKKALKQLIQQNLDKKKLFVVDGDDDSIRLQM